jgi:uncharacterized protein YkwD
MLNQMRPQKIFWVASGFLLALLFTAPVAPISGAQTQFDSAGEKELVGLINQERAREGVSPLAVDERLTQAARKHTELMVKHRKLSHQSEDEQPLQVRLADVNLRSDRQAENVALEMDVAGVHAILMNSPPHRANIISPKYNAIGVGIMQSGDRLYVTEDFARRLPDYSDLEADEILQKTITEYASARGAPAPARKAQSALHEMACNMALIDALDTGTPRSIPGVHRVLAWTATDLEELPDHVKTALSQPMPLGYSLGICFAPSVSHPGGMYWIAMVMY